jgi:hypothetical protein
MVLLEGKVGLCLVVLRVPSGASGAVRSETLVAHGLPGVGKCKVMPSSTQSAGRRQAVCGKVDMYLSYRRWQVVCWVVELLKYDKREE